MGRETYSLVPAKELRYDEPERFRRASTSPWLGFKTLLAALWALPLGVLVALAGTLLHQVRASTLDRFPVGLVIALVTIAALALALRLLRNSRGALYLMSFSFAGTDLCAPANAGFGSWLAQLAVLEINTDCANTAPQVSAGSAQTVSSGATVQLSASAPDAEFNVLAYQWQQLSGPAVSLSEPEALTTRFTAPVVSNDTQLQFRFTADDGIIRDILGYDGTYADLCATAYFKSVFNKQNVTFLLH